MRTALAADKQETTRVTDCLRIGFILSGRETGWKRHGNGENSRLARRLISSDPETSNALKTTALFRRAIRFRTNIRRTWNRVRHWQNNPSITDELCVSIPSARAACRCTGESGSASSSDRRDKLSRAPDFLRA
jgi:hypothetical protein